LALRRLFSAPAFWTPSPGGVVAQRRPIRAVSENGREVNDRPDRASGGLPQGFVNSSRRLGSAIAKHAHCA
jgi:uncharacterized protein (DUF1800 family)